MAYLTQLWLSIVLTLQIILALKQPYPSKILTKRPNAVNALLNELIDATTLPQSQKSRNEVERITRNLADIADSNPRTFRKSVASGSWRTLWSSVTANTLIGRLLKLPPSNILGGKSWQTISPDLKESENVVYWEPANLRMVGLTRLNPYKEKNSNVGYDLEVYGLDFRWASKLGVPEAIYGVPPRAKASSTGPSKSNPQEDIFGRMWNVFAISEENKLSNGVGRLEVLYNDGDLRITRENTQKLTYIHMREKESSQK